MLSIFNVWIHTIQYWGYNIVISRTNCISYFALSQLYSFKNTFPTHINLSSVKSLIIPIFDYSDIVYHEDNISWSLYSPSSLRAISQDFPYIFRSVSRDIGALIIYFLIWINKFHYHQTTTTERNIFINYDLQSYE